MIPQHPLCRLHFLLGTTAIVVGPLFDTFVVQNLLDILLLELTVLVVAVRLIEGIRNNVENVRTLLENIVHLFQGAKTSLGKEEVHAGKNKRVAGEVSLVSTEIK